LTNQITLEKALELVEFELCPEGWRVKSIKGGVYGSVWGDIWGNVWSTIKGRRWKFFETPKEGDNQLDDSNE